MQMNFWPEIFSLRQLAPVSSIYPLALHTGVPGSAETRHASETSFVCVWTKHSTPRPSDANHTEPPPLSFCMFLLKQQTHSTRFRSGQQLNPQPCGLLGSWYSAWSWPPADGSWTWPAQSRPTGAPSTTWQASLRIWWWNRESGTSAEPPQRLDPNCATSKATTKFILTARSFRSLKEWWSRHWSWRRSALHWQYLESDAGRTDPDGFWLLWVASLSSALEPWPSFPLHGTLISSPASIPTPSKEIQTERMTFARDTASFWATLEASWRSLGVLWCSSGFAPAAEDATVEKSLEST